MRIDWATRRLLWAAGALVGLALVYFVAWPVPIEPVAWEAPANPGYTGVFAVNERLKGIETFPIGDNVGPEAVAVDGDGRVYVSTKEGRIVRLQADGSNPENWAETGGRPLGMEFDADGSLIVADAHRGLLSVAPDGSIDVLATEADGIPIRFANDVDVAPDGRIYFTDASSKFAPADWGGTTEAAVLELMEHAGNGRLLVYTPEIRSATTVLDGLNYANGVAVAHDGSFVLVNDMGSYRLLRVWLKGPFTGSTETFIEELPGFPDNTTRGLGGRYWIAFVSPRNALVDRMSGRPFLRKVIQRLPPFLRPAPVNYGHVIAVDDDGRVLEDLQDPEGTLPVITGVRETEEFLWLGSLEAPAVGRIAKTQAECCRAADEIFE